MKIKCSEWNSKKGKRWNGTQKLFHRKKKLRKCYDDGVLYILSEWFCLWFKRWRLLRRYHPCYFSGGNSKCFQINHVPKLHTGRQCKCIFNCIHCIASHTVFKIRLIYISKMQNILWHFFSSSAEDVCAWFFTSEKFSIEKCTMQIKYYLWEYPMCVSGCSCR